MPLWFRELRWIHRWQGVLASAEEVEEKIHSKAEE
jgi:hypothetical protein